MGVNLTDLEMKAYNLGIMSVSDGIEEMMLMLLGLFSIWLILAVILSDTTILFGMANIAGLAVAVFVVITSIRLGYAGESANSKIEFAFNNMDETLRVDSKPLKSFELNKEDKAGLVGEIERVSSYICGEEVNNTVVSYTFFNSNGGMDADKMEYDSDIIDIIETDEVDPKIEKLTYTKQVLNEVEERVEYKFYVPVGTISNL